MTNWMMRNWWPTKRRWVAAVAAALVLPAAVAACGSASKASSATTNTLTTLSSPAFASGANLPAEYACTSANMSPPLEWTGHAASWAVTLVDTDAPAGTGILWVVSGLRPSVHALPSGAIPVGAVEGRRSDGGTGYYGPCPPSGAVHHFVFTVDALPALAGLTASTPATQALAWIGAHRVAQASLSALFAR